ncbi:MAG: gamma-glutamylcyclotransferase [Leptospiraceae bacterium]|nr:MAG: gamma-glutamylcyclotransferase [Leptospiraceae bacterium]
MDYIFVYGTLLSDFNHPLNQKLQKEGHFIGNGFVLGKLYDVGEYPAAIPSPESIIIGELYKIPETLFFDLDDYEDYNPYYPDESLFKRKKTKVFLIKNIDLKPEEYIKFKDQFPKIFSWIYWYNRPVVNLKRIEDFDYRVYKKKYITYL